MDRSGLDWGAVVRDVARAHEGTAVPGITRLQGDASSRPYYRVSRDGASVIAMRLADDPLKSDEVVDGERPRSVPFLDVGAWLRRGGVPVPEVLHADLDAGVILLEDLGDRTVERALAEGEDKGALYRMAVRLLVVVHAHAARDPDPDCICFRRRFGEGLLRWELEHFYEYGVVALTGRTPTPGERGVLEEFFADVVRRLCALPQGFVHRDFQSRNLMIHGGRLRLIDFQDALLGPYVYDLVALLRDSYVAFDRDEVLAIQRVFLEERAARGLHAPDPTVLMDDFQLQALQRKLKDAGRFVYLDRVKGNPKFLPNIPRSLAYAREALDHLGGYEAARAVLAGYLPEHFA